MPSRCLLTKILQRSSVGSLLRVHCWLGIINQRAFVCVCVCEIERERGREKNIASREILEEEEEGRGASQTADVLRKKKTFFSGS